MTEQNIPPKVTSEDRQALAEAVQASAPESVESAFGSLSFGPDSPSLLAGSHRQFLATGTAEIAYADNDLDEASAYAGAAALGHHVDAWSYFGMATSAIANGQPAIARHLAYYSELRAAFSILARHGMVIRSTTHLVIQSDGKVHTSHPSPTHEAVWHIFKVWMRTEQARALFLDKALVGGVSIQSWLEAAGIDLTGTMSELLQEIGYDLHQFEKDRGLRNASSYAPRWLRSDLGAADAALKDLPAFWRLSEPTGNSGFEQMDAFLAALLLAKGRRKAQKSTQPDLYRPFLVELGRSINALTPEISGLQLAEIGTQSMGDTSIGLAFDTKRDEKNPVERTRAMLARAFVLARYSSAAIRDLALKAGVTDDNLEYWLSRLGTETRLWDTHSGLLQRDQLLDEIASATEDLELDLAPSVREFSAEQIGDLDKLLRYPLLSSWIVQDLSRPLPRIA
jgi:hypothetical protein